MKHSAALLICLFFLPGVGNAGVFNISTFTCDSYENQILNHPPAESSEDAVNYAMWLFGYAIGRKGDHSIYSNGLQTFGTALDEECKRRPTASVLDALGSIDPANENPMDLKELDCATFETRHADMAKSDLASARTIMMWLYGFSTAKAGGRVVDTDAVDDFDKALAKQCSKHAQGTLYDALIAVRMTKQPR
jgi:hypothetical protein